MRLKTALTVLLSLLTSLIFSQSRFDKGYFIDNSGQRTECLIRDEGWLSSPAEVKYRLRNEQDNTLSFRVSDVSEFGTDNKTVYKRVTADFIVSSQMAGSVDRTFEFRPVPKTVFVKQLVFGNVRLFLYRESSISNFLLQINDQPLEVLRYKKYSEIGFKIKENNEYRRQILRMLPCKNLSVQNLVYAEQALINYIEEYRKCSGNNQLNSYDVVKENIGSTNFKILAGIQALDFKFYDISRGEILDFENKIVFKGGLEIERILEFNNNKWSIFLSPSFMRYVADLEGKDLGSFQDPYTLELSRLEILIGGRHYMFINNTTALFLEMGITLDKDFNSGITSEFNENDSPNGYQEIRKFNFGSGFGVGVNISQKYYVKGNYFLKQNILRGYKTGNELSRINLILGIKVL